MEGDAGGRCGSHLRHDRRRETAATAGRRRQRGDRSRMVLRVARRTAISCNCRRRILDRAHRVLKNIGDPVDAAGVRTPLAHLHHILVGACVSLPTSPPPVGCPIDSNEAASLQLRVLRCERSETIFVCSDGGSSNRYARPTPSLLAAQRQHNARKNRTRDVLRRNERPARSFSYVKLMFHPIPFRRDRPSRTALSVPTVPRCHCCPRSAAAVTRQAGPGGSAARPAAAPAQAETSHRRGSPPG